MCANCLDGHVNNCDSSACPCPCNDRDFPLNLKRTKTNGRIVLRMAIAAALGLALACAPIHRGGAATHFAAGQRLVTVDPKCLTAPLEFLNCNFALSPPPCKLVRVQYRKGCEQLKVTGGKTK